MDWDEEIRRKIEQLVDSRLLDRVSVLGNPVEGPLEKPSSTKWAWDLVKGVGVGTLLGAIVSLLTIYQIIPSMIGYANDNLKETSAKKVEADNLLTVAKATLVSAEETLKSANNKLTETEMAISEQKKAVEKSKQELATVNADVKKLAALVETVASEDTKKQALAVLSDVVTQLKGNPDATSVIAAAAKYKELEGKIGDLEVDRVTELSYVKRLAGDIIGVSNRLSRSGHSSESVEVVRPFIEEAGSVATDAEARLKVIVK